MEVNQYMRVRFLEIACSLELEKESLLLQSIKQKQYAVTIFYFKLKN